MTDGVWVQKYVSMYVTLKNKILRFVIDKFSKMGLCITGIDRR